MKGKVDTIDNRTDGRNDSEENFSKSPLISKLKIVVIMGATGSGKSRFAIDLASYLPIEIINADSMQVYQGLDVLTNKVPFKDQKGVPHHLLGAIDPSVEFTSKHFRDNAISDRVAYIGRIENPAIVGAPGYFFYDLIDDIISRNHLPVLVGGTNYYIQALVSPFLLDDSHEYLNESCLSDSFGEEQLDSQQLFENGNSSCSYETLKDLDPVSANRIHPNDYRKNWGNIDDHRYNCCFICVDAALPIIDQYVEQRVDHMVDAGLLGEVYDIFNLNADYTRGLRQSIGVREFEEFLTAYLSKGRNGTEDDLPGASHLQIPTKYDARLKKNMSAILSSSDDNQLKDLLIDAIDKVKANTRRLVRRQKRRLTRLQTLFGWNIHYVDATECLSCMSENLWTANVIEPSVQVIRSYLNEDENLQPGLEAKRSNNGEKLMQRDLWTQYVCKACGNKVLRGAYEWEQHKQGRSHRKRVCKLQKSGKFGNQEGANVASIGSLAPVEHQPQELNDLPVFEG